MSRPLVVDNLIDEVRSLIDENNRENVSDETDILPALNRAQDYASNILSRHYEAPLLTFTDVSLTSGTADYDIPEDAFEQRIEKIEVQINGVFYPVKRLSYRDITIYETPSTVNIPYYYVVYGTKYRLIPSPTATYPLRLWYLKDPDPLVKQQGRITSVNTGSNYVLLDSIGSDLSTNVDNLNSYVRIIDGRSGVVKVNLQIQSTDSTTGRITFKSTPTRSTVLGKTISGAITTAGIEADDYICTIHGSCIPFIKKPFSNFLIEYAVAEMQRKLGGGEELERIVLEKLEKQVERSWVGREQSLRVKKRTRFWPVSARRYYHSS